jgi:glycosyltransferase involved in cell wall biosynthesis
MRIAIWHDLPSGGGKRALYDHVSGLLGLGHQVDSWCTSTADQRFLPLSDLVTEHVVGLELKVRQPAHALANWATSGATGTYELLRAMDLHSRECAAQINQRQFDLVLVGSSYHVGAPPIGRYLESPSVLYLQEPYRQLYEALPRLPWPALPHRSPGVVSGAHRLRDSALVRALRVQAREELDNVRSYDRVLANSHFSRESMVRAFGIDPRVCYLGVDTTRYKDFGLPRKRVVVGIGEFDPRKRVEVAIRAVSRLSTPRPALNWVGNAANEQYLRGLRELARKSRVDFAPLVAVPHDKVVDLLNEASVMLYAPRLEPFGYAPLEGGACGLPVVARAEGGVRESVVHDETGWLVEDDDGLADALERALADDELRSRARTSARKHIETTWSLEGATRRLEAHLAEVAGQAQVPRRTP